MRTASLSNAFRGVSRWAPAAGPAGGPLSTSTSVLSTSSLPAAATTTTTSSIRSASSASVGVSAAAQRSSPSTVAGSTLTQRRHNTSDKRQKTAQQVFRGMVGPQGMNDAVQSKAVPINGRATAKGTKGTIQRSTVFDEWSTVSPHTGWHLSKLGCTTCKMPKDMNESQDALQLQIIKGLNVFEIDGSANEVYQNVNKTFQEVLTAFELDREGIVFVLRCGVFRQPPNIKDQSNFDVNNLGPIRARMEPVIGRTKAASLPNMTLKGGFVLEEMDDEQLRGLKLRRMGPRSAAAVTPEWLEAAMTSVSYHMKMETVDCLLIEGLHTLYDGRPEEEIEKDILEVFKMMEQQAADGAIQHYGIASPNLAPPVPRVYPPLPPDACTHPKYMQPQPVPVTMNLLRIMELAKQAGGENHHMRFISYPFNLTQSQARGVKLPYAPKHTLCSLAKELGLTSLSYCPVETQDLQDKAQRYHRFPLSYDLGQLRQNFFHLVEKVILKEREIKPYIEKMPTPPPMEHVMIGSMFMTVQLQLSNYFQFMDWTNYDVLPPLRTALMRVREGSVKDIKDWANAFDQMVTDMLRFRQQMYEHRHGAKSFEIDAAIDRHCPRLQKCPILTQKALNFATAGADVTMCGFHQSRYFHEATDLNPLRGNKNALTDAEVQALCDTKEVSFCDYNPPHPYMMEAFPTVQGKFSRQQSGSAKLRKQLDPQNPEWPDIPKQVEEDMARPPKWPQAGPGSLPE